MESKIYDDVKENTARISNLEKQFVDHDANIKLMQKDYEYMKKSLDNIEHQTLSNFNVINMKLDDIFKQKSAETKKQVEDMKELKSYVIKTTLGLVVGAILLYLFPFLK
ncbi:hypothetical protein HMPREF9709_01179 [Helcococcus kunzii ATCC 51366]|uniref:Uncharacterized protein n=1 Tax=Helcococcus kunzii ATCC 51366 TaxID=883114 RepID=H3NPB8_9FIRM|nr:hypothetical protein [Helcococcus kunzii]EHR33431.1 hypothetical protein HMPREF9709_01179 [Helcococcus kunzii ATCC 51366]